MVLNLIFRCRYESWVTDVCRWTLYSNALTRESDGYCQRNEVIAGLSSSHYQYGWWWYRTEDRLWKFICCEVYHNINLSIIR